MTDQQKRVSMLLVAAIAFCITLRAYKSMDERTETRVPARPIYTFKNEVVMTNVPGIGDVSLTYVPGPSVDPYERSITLIGDEDISVADKRGDGAIETLSTLMALQYIWQRTERKALEQRIKELERKLNVQGELSEFDPDMGNDYMEIPE